MITLFLIKSTLLGLACWALTRFWPRSSAALRFQAWSVFLLLLPLCWFAAPQLRSTYSLRIAADASGLSLASTPSWPSWLLLALPTIFLLARLLIRQAKAWRLWNSAQVSPLGADIRVSRQIRGPLAYGLSQGGVLLPPQAETWPIDILQPVLAHERAHVQRRDNLYQCFAEALRAIFWIQPFAWFACAQMRREREFACDDEVLLAGADHLEYAQTLIQLASTPPAPLPAANGRGARELELRMHSLLSPQISRRRASVLSGLTIGALCLGLLYVSPVLSQDAKPAVFARVLTKVEPAYTQSARDRKIEGTAVLKAKILTSGIATDFRVLRSIDEGLDEEAIRAVTAWRFEPAKDNAGYPMDSNVTIEIHFRLK